MTLAPNLAVLFVPGGSRASPLTAFLRSPRLPEDGIRDSVRDVLSRPEYREPPRGLVERLRDLAAEGLERALGALVGGGRGAWLAWVILAAALTGMAIVAFRFAGGVTRDAARSAPLATVRRRSAADWRAEA